MESHPCGARPTIAGSLANGLIVRRATAGDASALASLRIEFMRIVKNCGIEDEASWQRGLESYFARALGSGRVLAWLCLDGGATVATAALRVDSVREGRGPHGAREGYVMSVYTMAPWRRLGISTRLLGEVIAEARSIGLVRLVLHPTEDALPLYRGLGFHEFRTVMILPL